MPSEGLAVLQSAPGPSRVLLEPARGLLPSRDPLGLCWAQLMAGCGPDALDGALGPLLSFADAHRKPYCCPDCPRAFSGLFQNLG